MLSLLQARVPTTLLSHWHSLSCWASGLHLLWCTCSIYFRSFSPNFQVSPPLSSQLISKTGYLLSFTLVGAPYPVGAWLPSPPGCQLPFSLTDGSSPVEALPLSLFRGTCYPSLFLALSILLAPDLSLPLGPRIWGLRVLRCRLARTLAVIVSSAVHSSFLLSVSHQRVSTIEVKC